MSRSSIMRTFYLFLFSFALLLAGCAEAPASTDAKADATPAVSKRVVRVNTTTVALSPFEEIIPITGVVDAPNDASLSAQSAGTITSLVQVGTTISKGEVIARLDDRLMMAALEQSKANLTSAKASADFAEDTFRRQEPLYADSIISAIEFENARTQLNQARAFLAQAEATVSQVEQQLENTFVRAPFSGTVEERFVETGEQVVPGSPIVRIVDTRHLKIRAGVPEKYSSDIKVGSPVSISFKSYGGDLLRSGVSFVGSVINPKNRTFTIEVDIKNDGKTLKPEMIADVLVTRRQLTDQIVLPQTAILIDENGSSVYVVDRSGGETGTELRPIELGPSYGGFTVISTGLDVGHEVITTGQTMVAEGDLLEISSNNAQ